MYIINNIFNIEDRTLFTKPNYLSPLIQQNRSFVNISPPSISEIDYEHFKKFIDQNDALIIDVRSKEELATTGVLPNSHNIPSMNNTINRVNHLTSSSHYFDKY